MLSAESYFVKWPQLYSMDPQAAAVTGLSFGFCQEVGHEARSVFSKFIMAKNRADYICGHNAIHFDVPMVKSNWQRAKLCTTPDDNTPGLKICDRPLIDTLHDLPYPESQTMMKLKYLACDHGYNLVDAHSALADVLACKHLLSCYPFEKVLEISKTPLINVKAYCSWDELEIHKKLKNGRFYFNKQGKCWERKIREYFLKDLESGMNLQIEMEYEAVEIS